MDIKSLKLHLEEHGQGHLLEFWDELDFNQQVELHNDLSRLNIPQVIEYFKTAMNAHTTEKLDDRIERIPEEHFSSSPTCSPENIQKYKEIGLKCSSEGKVAVLLLGGGQGSRLGVNYPKGMYDVGLPSHKSLFQIQAERLIKIQQIAQQGTATPWYIMNSEGTKHQTIEYFQSKNYFGLDENNVIVFEQGMLPAFTLDGKIILENKYKIFKAPDGNGGLYKALKNQGIFQDMKSRGIEYVHVYCVDNILIKMADPVFLGYCIAKNADSGAKVVEKIIPTEPVGVFCKVDAKYQVVEYSEITNQAAEKRNPKAESRLLFNADSHQEEFSPLKNSDSELQVIKDTPTTCRKDLLLYNLQQLLNAGVKIVDPNNNVSIIEVEISPLVSYDGEDLEYITNNLMITANTTTAPLLIIKKAEKLSEKSKANIHILEV